MRKVLLFFFYLALLISCTESKVKISSTSTEVDSGPKATVNKQKFLKSEIISPSFDKELIFGVWGTSIDAPACEYEINEKRLLLCDYDGDGERLYKIFGDSILLDNPTLIFRGRILKLTNDSLIIHWQNNKAPEILLRWPKAK